MSTNNWGKAFDRLLDKLCDACDKRLQDYDKTGRDDNVRAWLKKKGFDSAYAMMHVMIQTLRSEIGLDVVAGNIVVDSVESDGGYMVPVIRILAEYEDPHTYKVWGNGYKSYELPCWISRKCFESLTEANQDHLKSLDYDNLAAKDGHDVYESGNYDVWIEIDCQGEISYHSCDSLY